ncbi:MAG: alpha/beta hydrolase [Kiritimatiellia bacterium]
MKRLTFLQVFAAAAAGLVFVARASFGPLSPSAQPCERQYIWPEGKMPHAQAHQIAATTGEAQRPGFRADDFRRPYIDWFAPNPASKTDVCVLVVSGGGFACCCDAERLQPAIDRFVRAGFTVANLTYRTPRPEGLPIHQSAWEDAQRAVRVVRSEAAKRGFNPSKIGATGISAGAKTVLLLATSSLTPAYAPVDEIDKLPCNLLFAIPQAPSFVLTDGEGTQNQRDGDAPDVKIVPELKFDAQTCPMCFFQGGLDDYSPNGSTQIYRQLRRMKIPAELHLFADRPHGFHGDMNKGDEGEASDHWFTRAEEFIRQMNFDGRLGAEESLMKRFPDDSARGAYAKEEVWPKGLMPNAQTNQCTPYIEWHIPKTLRTKAIQIIYSGGAYMGNGPDGFEVAPARRYLNAKGMTVVTMRYRAPRPQGLAKHTTAWQDLQRAIRIVRSKAAAKGLDPDRIGIMGSSAGGHLTLMGATSSKHRAYWPIDDLDKISCGVQWAIAIYPAYALTDGGNAHNKTGGNADDARLVPEFSFDLATCPILFIHGDADGWAAMNSVKCWEQLRRMGIQGELHTLATRNHCFQRTAAPGTGSYTWIGRIWEFMNHRGCNR